MATQIGPQVIVQQSAVTPASTADALPVLYVRNLTGSPIALAVSGLTIKSDGVPHDVTDAMAGNSGADWTALETQRASYSPRLYYYWVVRQKYATGSLVVQFGIPDTLYPAAGGGGSSLPTPVDPDDNGKGVLAQDGTYVLGPVGVPTHADDPVVGATLGVGKSGSPAWVRRGYINPKEDCGAQCNGTFDDSTAFLQALEAAQTTGDQFGRILIPDGTMRIGGATAVLKDYADKGVYLDLFGYGQKSKILIDLDYYLDGIVINNTVQQARFGIRDCAFVAKQGQPIQSYRLVTLGGTHFAAPYLKNVDFAGVQVAGAVVKIGNGASNALVQDCTFIGCTAEAHDDGVDPAALIHADIIFGYSSIRNRFLTTDYYDGANYSGGAARYAELIGRFDIPDGSINSSRAYHRSNAYGAAARFAISTLRPNGLPTGPTSAVNYEPFGRGAGYGQKTGPGIGTWDWPSGSPSGGWDMPYVMEISIDSTGTAGVATWSTRFQTNGFQSPATFSTPVSHGTATSATVNGITLTMTGNTYDVGKNYYLYVTGNKRVEQMTVFDCDFVSAGADANTAILAADINKLVIDMCHADDAAGQTRAVELYGVHEALIRNAQFHNHKIIAQPAGFGFSANQYVCVENANPETTLLLSNAVRSQVISKGVITTSPPFPDTAAIVSESAYASTTQTLTSSGPATAVGTLFVTTADVQPMLGVHFGWGPSSDLVTCELWNTDDESVIATVDLQTGSSRGEYDAFFAAPVTLSPLKQYRLTVYSNTGSVYWYVTKGNWDAVTNTAPINSTTSRPGIFRLSGVYGSGHSYPSGNDSTFIPMVEPILGRP